MAGRNGGRAERCPAWRGLITVTVSITAAALSLGDACAGEVATSPAPIETVSASHCANPAALGTSRVLEVGTQGGPAVGLKSYPQTLRLSDHEVVLTFDDGPLPGPTGAVLDALARECVKATFFLIGRNAAQHPALVRREVAEGHTVAHHSQSHPEATLRGLAPPEAERDLMRGIAAVEKAGWGADARPEAPHVPFFRFPGFADTPALRAFLASRNIAIFGADVWASDWKPMTPEAQLDLLMTRLDAAGRGIVLLHDTRQQTVAMLPRFLGELKRRGYRVVHIVPGSGAANTVPAPAGWTSETEATVQRILHQRSRSAAAKPAAVPPGGAAPSAGSAPTASPGPAATAPSRPRPLPSSMPPSP
ncbi:polysaccharide deacetylase family protein [Ancylobacter terrae]|uniref:polysaccharide deacetylase family protein n=1 Tax=Ancylobacter sp. sgz301288 TaxID=3342077 RepID=UPI00385B578B